jgi:hypothetical protein
MRLQLRFVPPVPNHTNDDDHARSVVSVHVGLAPRAHEVGSSLGLQRWAMEVVVVLLARVWQKPTHAISTRRTFYHCPNVRARINAAI